MFLNPAICDISEAQSLEVKDVSKAKEAVGENPGDVGTHGGDQPLEI